MAYKVSELVKNLNSAIRMSRTLSRIEVEGEIVGFNGRNKNGHIYFDLKDKDDAAIIKCMMFSNKVTREYLDIIREGAKVTVFGSLNYHEKFGLSFVFERISDGGEGARKRALEALRRELEELGMFDDMYKKPLPRFPMTIGLITASSGAAIGDVLTSAREYNPYVRVVVRTALQEGETAVREVCDAIRKMDEYGPDVIILTRGGGSKDSLWTFNDREVAQAVFDCRTPIISAIGHQRDESIVDDIADDHQITPTAAAHKATEGVRDLLSILSGAPGELTVLMKNRIASEKKRLSAASDAVRFNSPISRLERDKKELEKFKAQLPSLMNTKLTAGKQAVEKYRLRLPALIDSSVKARKTECDKYRLKLPPMMNASIARAVKKRDVYISRLEGLSPILRLKSGFSYVSDKNGKNIRSVSGIKSGDEIEIRVTDGKISSVVKEVDHLKEVPDGS